MNVQGDYEPRDAGGFIKINALRWVTFSLFFINRKRMTSVHGFCTIYSMNMKVNKTNTAVSQAARVCPTSF